MQVTNVTVGTDLARPYQWIDMNLEDAVEMTTPAPEIVTTDVALRPLPPILTAMSPARVATSLPYPPSIH